MKTFRFSLSHVFVFLVIAAAASTLGRGLASESSLWAVWVASFLNSYWKSPVAGWPQMGRVTAITGTIWSIAILWSYLLSDDIDDTPTVLFAARGFFVALAGIILALSTVGLVEGARWASSRWLRLERQKKAFVGLAILASMMIGWGTWTATRVQYWEPTLAKQSHKSSLPSEFAALNLIKQRHGLQHAHFVGSKDGRFIAARTHGERKVLVFNPFTRELIADFFAGDGAWFGPLALRSDGTTLAAILYSRSDGPKLVQWDTRDWKSHAPISIDSLLARSFKLDGDVSLALDHRFLLIIRSDERDKNTIRVEIFTVDLCYDQLTIESFVSATLEHDRLVTAWKNHNLVPETLSWIASPNGKWIASSGKAAYDFRDYLFSKETNVSRLSGRVLGFLSDGDHLIIGEVSERLAWRTERQAGESSPPFWNYLRTVPMCRVVILDCRNQRTITKSRWLQINRPYMTPSQSQLVVEVGIDSVLFWDLPEAK